MEKLNIVKDLSDFKFNNWDEKLYTDYLSYCTDDEKKEFVDLQSKNSLDKLIKQCALESLKKTITARFNIYWSDFLENEEVCRMYPIFKDIEVMQDKKDKCQSVFITVNPRSDVSLKIFKDTLVKATSKSWITNYIYVIEQRGETEDELGKGMHAHILLFKGKKKLSELVREMGNTFKKLLDVSNSSLLNIQGCKDDDVDKRLNYMLGKKQDENKHLKQEMDILYRQLNALEHHYGKWE